MKKRFNFTSALTVVLSSALIAMTTLPVLASNTNYDFDFSFDAGNTCVTSTEYKETRHAITMYCTWEEGVSGSSYAVRPRGRSSGIWGGEYNMYEGKVSDGMEPEYMMRVYICRQDLIQMIQTHSQVIGIQMMRSIKIS